MRMLCHWSHLSTNTVRSSPPEGAEGEEGMKLVRMEMLFLSIVAKSVLITFYLRELSRRQSQQLSPSAI